MVHRPIERNFNDRNFNVFTQRNFHVFPQRNFHVFTHTVIFFVSQNFLWMIGENELISLLRRCHTLCVYRFAGTQSIIATIPETMDHLALPLGFILSFSILSALAPCMYLFCRTVPIFWLSFTQTCLVFFICLLSFSVLCLSTFHLPRTNCIKKHMQVCSLEFSLLTKNEDQN